MRCFSLDGELHISSAATEILGGGTTTLSGNLFTITSSTGIISDKNDMNKEFLLPAMWPKLYQDLRDVAVAPEHQFQLHYTFPGPNSKTDMRAGKM